MSLQNNEEKIPPLNRVTARGKKYVYIRGTDIALVKGFSGTPEELEGAIVLGFAEYTNRAQGLVRQLRETAAISLHKRTLGRARAKCRPYFLTAAIIGQMLEEARDQCALTGLAFDYHEKVEGDEWWRRPLAPSIDRLDNGLGYELGHIRIVCTAINIAINEWGIGNFDRICRAYVAKSAPT